MKNFLKTLLLTGLFINAPSVHAEDFKPSSNVVTLMPIVMDNLDNLMLTPEQLDAIRGVARENFSQVEFINAEYHDLKTQLKEELLDPAGSKKVSLELTKTLADLDQKRLQLTTNCVFNLKKILTPEQFNEVLELESF